MISFILEVLLTFLLNIIIIGFYVVKHVKDIVNNTFYGRNYESLRLVHKGPVFDEYTYSTSNETTSLYFLKDTEDSKKFLQNPSYHVSKKNDLICFYTETDEFTRQMEKFVYYFDNTNKDLTWNIVLGTFDNSLLIQEVHILHAKYLENITVSRDKFNDTFHIHGEGQSST